MSEPVHCVNHPGVETYLRCNRCGAPICPRCAVRTEVGYRCKSCINRQQQMFYADFRPVYYLVAAAIALPLALIGGWIVPNLGWFAIFLGPLVGLGIAEAVSWAIRRRRGRYVWLVVAGSIVVGGAPFLLIKLIYTMLSLGHANSMFGNLLGNAWFLIWDAIYLFTAVGAAIARLRPGRR